jgi:hypothetical protein
VAVGPFAPAVTALPWVLLSIPFAGGCIWLVLDWIYRLDSVGSFPTVIPFLGSLLFAFLWIWQAFIPFVNRLEFHPRSWNFVYDKGAFPIRRKTLPRACASSAKASADKSPNRRVNEAYVVEVSGPDGTWHKVLGLSSEAEANKLVNCLHRYAAGE